MNYKINAHFNMRKIYPKQCSGHAWVW